jgi:hypothetical protein
VPLLAWAQSIYKVQMPDGSILFTDTVPADAKVLEERAARSARPVPSAPARTATTTTTTSSSGPMMPAPAPRSRAAVESAANNVQNAERELAVAKRALETGREPLPGERLGLKGGGSRLSPEYDERIRTLEQAVAEAETKVKRAYDTRNASR